MKQLIGFAALVVLLSGCATQVPLGMVMTDNTLPMQVGDSSARCTKTGMATSKSYMGLIATGDASLNTAAKNGGITKIHHADWKVKNTLGFFGEYTTIVYGE
jgi:hypothetical protein